MTTAITEPAARAAGTELQLLSELAGLVPGAGPDGRATAETLSGWIIRGILVRKQRIRLRGLRIGGRWYSTREWLMSFIDETTRAYDPKE